MATIIVKREPGEPGRRPAAWAMGTILLSSALLAGCGERGGSSRESGDATAPAATDGPGATLSLEKLRAFAKARDAVVLLSKDENRCPWAYAGEDSASCWRESGAIKTALAKEGLTVDEFLDLQKAWMEAATGFGSAADVAFVKRHEAELHELQPGDDGLSRNRKTGG